MWCTRFRPQNLEDLTLHNDVTKVLLSLSKSENLPHLIFCGKAGSGRHTRALALLKRIYGVRKISSVTSTLTYIHNGESRELPCVKSNIHVELNPALANVADTSVVQSVIRDAAASRAVNQSFKTIFIQEADRLSFQAQQALRRLLEEHAKICRLVFFCENISGLLPPLRSRCFIIRLPNIQKAEMIKIGKEILQNLNIWHLEDDSINQLAIQAQGNLRRFLLLLQSLDVSLKASTAKINKIDEILPEWQQKVNSFAAQYIQPNLTITEDFRTQLVEIIKKGVPYDILLKQFVNIIVNDQKYQQNSQLMQFVANQACEYDSRLQNSLYGLIHLEAFLLSVIHYIKTVS